MPLAAKFDTPAGTLTSGRTARTLGTRRIIDMVRDLALLVAACLTVGLVVGFGVMLAVLLMS